MKKINLLVTLLLFVGFSFGIQAQDKATKTSQKKVDLVDKQIKAGGYEAGLTEAQKEEILALHVEKFNKHEKIKKSNATKEEKKAKMQELNKALGKKIAVEVLNKEQRKAKQKGAALLKENKK